MCVLGTVGAQSGLKFAGIPPPLSCACLVGAFAAGVHAGLGRGGLEPHRDVVLKGNTRQGQVVNTHRQGERNRARTAKARARVHLLVPAPPSAGRSALESLLQRHVERSAGTLFRC